MTTEIDSPARLLRITEVATEVGLTARSIRYYEELGLLKPAARSEGDYRLYDADDVERLRFIRGLRDDAGFSLGDIGRLLEDEAARVRNRARFREATDPVERRGIVADALARMDDQIAILRAKHDRIQSMIAEAEGRRRHFEVYLADLDAGLDPGHPGRKERAPRRTQSGTARAGSRGGKRARG